MTSFEILAAIRQHKFPGCTRVAVEQLATIYLRGGVASIPGLASNGDELEEQIVAEFITFKNTKKKLNAIQDLQVIEILLKFFESQSNEAVRHAVLKALFGRTSDDGHQLSLLSKFVSMAVGLKNTNVLNSAAVWMQSKGCNSDVVLHVIDAVIADYTQFTDSASSPLGQLPMVSAHFTCSLLTALTSVYSLPGSRSNKPVLSRQLLNLICDWMTVEQQLCLISLHQVHVQYAQSQRAALWTSPTKPNTQTPVPGLVRWCTTASLTNLDFTRLLIQLYEKFDTIKRIPSGSDTSTFVDANTEDATHWVKLWSRLHLLVLQTLMAFPSLPGARQLELVTLADMNQTVKEVVAHVSMIPTGLNDPSAETAVNRLVQILQVALTTGAFRCSLSDLKGICQRIPPCRLLKIVQSQHLSSAPPLMHNAS